MSPQGDQGQRYLLPIVPLPLLQKIIGKVTIIPTHPIIVNPIPIPLTIFPSPSSPPQAVIFVVTFAPRISSVQSARPWYIYPLLSISPTLFDACDHPPPFAPFPPSKP